MVPKPHREDCCANNEQNFPVISLNSISTRAVVSSTAEQAMITLLDTGATFDAVIAANDGMVVGALRSLTARGIRVPEDVLISGFDDIPITRFTEPTITTVRQPLQRMAELAVECTFPCFEQYSRNPPKVV